MTATPRRVARRLLRAPMFTLIAIFTLALGIGANTAIFSVVRGVLLKPLPFDDADRLVGRVAHGAGHRHPDPEHGAVVLLHLTGRGARLRGRRALEWRRRFGHRQRRARAGPGLFVTDGTLSLLHVNPILGRHFTRGRRLAEDTRACDAEPRLLGAKVRQRSRPSSASRSSSTASRARSSACCPPDSVSSIATRSSSCRSASTAPKLHAANFSYRGVARLKPGMTLEQANADVARLIPVIPDRFPMPPGFTRKMLDDVKIGPNVRPLVGRRRRRRRARAVGAPRNGRPRAAHRLRQRRQPVPGAGRSAAAGAGDPRRARRGLAPNRVGAALGEPHARAGGRRRRPRPGLRGHPRARRQRAGRTAAHRRKSVSIRSCCCSRWASRCLAGLLFGLLPVHEVRHAAPRVGAQGRRTRSRAPAANVTARATGWSSPKSRWPSCCSSPPGLMIRTFQAMRRRRPRLRAAGRSPHAARLDPRIDRRRRRAGDPDARADCAQARADSRACDRSACRTRSRWTATTATIRSSSRTSRRRRTRSRRCAASSGRRRTTSRRWATRSSPGREMTWADVYSRASVVIVSENFAREYLEGAGGRDRQAHPADAEQSLADDHRRRRQRARQRHRQARRRRSFTGRCLIDNYYDGKPFAQRNVAFAVRTDRAESPTLLKEIQQAVWIVNAQPAGRQRAHARPDPRRVDGADVVRAGDARHRGRRRAAPGRRRHLRRHRLRRAAAHEGDRHPHGARRRQP